MTSPRVGLVWKCKRISEFSKSSHTAPLALTNLFAYVQNHSTWLCWHKDFDMTTTTTKSCIRWENGELFTRRNIIFRGVLAISRYISAS